MKSGHVENHSQKNFFLIILNQVGVGMEICMGIFSPRVTFSNHTPYREINLSTPFLPPWDTRMERSYDEYVLHVNNGDKRKQSEAETTI